MVPAFIGELGRDRQPPRPGCAKPEIDCGCSGVPTGMFGGRFSSIELTPQCSVDLLPWARAWQDSLQGIATQPHLSSIGQRMPLPRRGQ